MARNLIQTALRKYARQIEVRILNLAKARMEKIGALVLKESNDLNKNFYKTFVQKAIDVPSAPDLGSYTPFWKPLKPNYQKLKEKVAPGAGFFRYKGDLKEGLLRLSPEALGPSTIKFVRIPNHLKKGTINEFRMELEPLPRLRNLRGIRLIEAVAQSGSSGVSMRLAAFRGRMTRKVVEPYVGWWVKYVIAPSVLRRMK